MILAYHRISDLSPDPWGLNVAPHHFAQHLEVLQSQAAVIRLEDLMQVLRHNKPRLPTVAITFDDGYADNLHGAKPLLEHYALPATVFAVSGMGGSRGEFWWDELARLVLKTNTLPRCLNLTLGEVVFHWKNSLTSQKDKSAHRDDCLWRPWQSPPSPRHALYQALWERLQPLPDPERRRLLDELRVWAGDTETNLPMHRCLTPAEILALADGGLIDIGAHTLTHPVLSRLDPAAQRREIIQSKSLLENILDRPVYSFAYPYGGRQDYDSTTTAIVQEAGFSNACINVTGTVKPTTDPFQLPRLYIPDVDGGEFCRILNSH